MTFLPSVPALLSSPGCCRARSAAGRAGGAGARRPGPWMCPGVCQAPRHTPRASPAAPGKKAGQDGGGEARQPPAEARRSAPHQRRRRAEAWLFLTRASAAPTGSRQTRWAGRSRGLRGPGLLGYPEQREGEE